MSLFPNRTQPTTIGGTIATPTSTTLSELDITGLPVGTVVWNAEVESYFVLTLSTASLDPDVVVEVKDTVGSRWIKDTAGGLTPTQEAKVDGYDYDGWFTEQQELMAAQVPALTNFKEVPIVFSADGVPAVNFNSADAGLAGGSITSDADKAASLYPLALFKTPITLGFAFAVRGVLAASTGGNFNYIGLINSAQTRYIGVATYSVTDATHYILYANAGAEDSEVSTVVADSDEHNFVVTFDLTTLKLFIDGALVASNTDLTQLSDLAVLLALTDHVAGDAIGCRLAIGYIAP